MLAAFLRGQFGVMLCLGVVYALGLWIVGVELALSLGMLAGLVSFVPTAASNSKPTKEHNTMSQVVIENPIINSLFDEISAGKVTKAILAEGNERAFIETPDRMVRRVCCELGSIPDFIACVNDGHGPSDLLNLIVEVTGEKKKDKAAKVSTARTLWVPAINNHGGWHWAFLEIDDPWNAQDAIRKGISSC